MWNNSYQCKPLKWESHSIDNRIDRYGQWDPRAYVYSTLWGSIRIIYKAVWQSNRRKSFQGKEVACYLIFPSNHVTHLKNPGLCCKSVWSSTFIEDPDNLQTKANIFHKAIVGKVFLQYFIRQFTLLYKIENFPDLLLLVEAHVLEITRLKTILCWKLDQEDVDVGNLLILKALVLESQVSLPVH